MSSPPLLLLLLTALGCHVSSGNAVAVARCQPGEFACGNSTQCVAQRFQCDHKRHCKNGADEENCGDTEGYSKNILEMIPTVNRTNGSCDLSPVPDECACVYTNWLNCSHRDLGGTVPILPVNVARLWMENSGISVLHPSDFANLTSVNIIDLRYNNIQHIPPRMFAGLPRLVKILLSGNPLVELGNYAFSGLSTGLSFLWMQHCQIERIQHNAFEGAEIMWLSMGYNKLTERDLATLQVNVDYLELPGNRIDKLQDTTFERTRIKTVKALYLNNNGLKYIERKSLWPLSSLNLLFLEHNQISELTEDVFQRNQHLQELSLSNNSLKRLPIGIFKWTPNLVRLQLEFLVLDNVKREHFSSLTKLERIKFSRFRYCRYAPQVRQCEPRTDGISSMQNLLELSVFRVFIWLNGIVTCVGNLFVIYGRVVLFHKHEIQSTLVSNLAAADLLMGLYLVVIGSHDVAYRNHYNEHASSWLESWRCYCSGMMGLLSSIASLLILILISVERCLVITQPLRKDLITFKSTVVILVFFWIFSIALAIFPQAFFDNFYGKNGVCFPLHMHEPYLSGWQYSAFIFLGVNSAAIIIVVICYLHIFIDVRRTQGKVTATDQLDLSLAKRFFMIILTDSACWLPVIILKSMALTNFVISDRIYAWMTIFVLPINSAINPVLYSISTAAFSEKMSHVFRNHFRRGSAALRRLQLYFASRRRSSCSSSASFANTQKSVISTLNGTSRDCGDSKYEDECGKQLVTFTYSPTILIHNKDRHCLLPGGTTPTTLNSSAVCQKCNELEEFPCIGCEHLPSKKKEELEELQFLLTKKFLNVTKEVVIKNGFDRHSFVMPNYDRHGKCISTMNVTVEGIRNEAKHNLSAPELRNLT